MASALRETGSILLDATRESVLQAVRDKVAAEPGRRRETSDRIELESRRRRSTYVVREAPGGGTRLILAHEHAQGPNLLRPREDLRLAVRAELFEVQRLMSLSRRP